MDESLKVETEAQVVSSQLICIEMLQTGTHSTCRDAADLLTTLEKSEAKMQHLKVDDATLTTLFAKLSFGSPVAPKSKTFIVKFTGCREEKTLLVNQNKEP